MAAGASYTRWSCIYGHWNVLSSITDPFPFPEGPPFAHFKELKISKKVNLKSASFPQESFGELWA